MLPPDKLDERLLGPSDAYDELQTLSDPGSLLSDLSHLAQPYSPPSHRLSMSPGSAQSEAPGLSFVAASLSLVKVSVGAGAMALPWATMQGGMASAPCLVLLALWNAYTAWLLLDCAPSGSFSDVTRLALGRPGVAALESSLLVVLMGVCISFQLQAATLLSSMLPIVPYPCCALLTGIALWPLLLQRTFHGVALLSAAALLALALGLAAVALYGIEAYGEPMLPARLKQWPSAPAFADFIGVAAFSFGYQVIVLPVRSAMRAPARAPAALAAASILVTLIYLAIGVGGAALFWRAGVKQLILLNIGPAAPVAKLVYGCSALVSILSVPLVFLPLVAIVKPLLLPPSASPLSDAAARTALLLLSTAAAASIRQFGLLAGFIGCLTGFYAQLLPPLVHLRLVAVREPNREKRIAKVGLDALLVVAGLVASVWPALTIAAQLASGGMGRADG